MKREIIEEAKRVSFIADRMRSFDKIYAIKGKVEMVLFGYLLTTISLLCFTQNHWQIDEKFTALGLAIVLAFSHYVVGSYIGARENNAHRDFESSTVRFMRIRDRAKRKRGLP